MSGGDGGGRHPFYLGGLAWRISWFAVEALLPGTPFYGMVKTSWTPRISWRAFEKYKNALMNPIPCTPGNGAQWPIVKKIPQLLLVHLLLVFEPVA